MPERLWTIHDTAEFLHVPVGTLYQWRHRGEGPPAFKAGNHLRYDPRAVMQWLEKSVA
jgi:excisionase family DNA binding protein